MYVVLSLDRHFNNKNNASFALRQTFAAFTLVDSNGKMLVKLNVYSVTMPMFSSFIYIYL